MKRNPKLPQAQSTLYTKTMELLKKLNDDGCSYLIIFQGTGLHPEWLAKLKQGKIKDPSVNRIEALHTFLVNYKPAE